MLVSEFSGHETKKERETHNNKHNDNVYINENHFNVENIDSEFNFDSIIPKNKLYTSSKSLNLEKSKSYCISSLDNNFEGINQVVKDGNMMKQCPVFYPLWQPRYFVFFSDGFIYYYENVIIIYT